MDHATALASLTRTTACPKCGFPKLEFLLRCDLEPGACHYTAHCRGCDMSFELVAGPRAPDRDALLDAVEPCARCGRERVLRLHCELESCTCVLDPVCDHCDA